jgi:poly-gamma-glutamate capsule biosynthesis protein CapA/YwtB (metallophosphatase superfamily)
MPSAMAGTTDDRATEGKEPRARLAAVGDLLLPVDPTGHRPPRPIDQIFAGVRDILAEADLVLGNLECTLPGDGETVPTEPRVISSPEMIRAIQPAGFHVVSLANNHTFDCFQRGFANLRCLLDELGIRYFGAGGNLEEATAPAVLEAGGVRVAFLGAADRRSGTRPFAGPAQWGVAPLDVDRLCRQIRELRSELGHVIVSPHWGQERLSIPSPEQVDQARRLIDAGASMVLGHHPHVLQGLELHQGRPIAYSLGNFVACEVPYVNGDAVRWNRTERTGCVVTAELTGEAVTNVLQKATYDDGRQVRLDAGSFGQRRIVKVNRALERGVTDRRYRRQSLWVNTIRPILQHMRWSQLKRIRPRHVVKLFRSRRRSRPAD